MRLLAKKPADRYPDAGYVIRDICLHSGREYKVETTENKISYVPLQGKLVGRDNSLQFIDGIIKKLFVDKAKNQKKLIIIKGKKGTGKSRLLKEISFHAKLNYDLATLDWHDIDSLVTMPSVMVLDEVPEMGRQAVSDFLLKNASQQVLVIYVESDPSFSWELSHEVMSNDFTKEQIAEYVKLIVNTNDLPEKITNQLWERTNGNPLLLTKLVKQLVERGYLVDESGPWQQSQIEDIDISIGDGGDSFDEFFAEELIRCDLDEVQIRFLRLLAVINRPVLLELMRDCSAERGKDSLDVESLIFPLVARHKILIEQDGRIEFINKAFSEFIYRNILSEERRQLHAEASKILPKDNLLQIRWHEACGHSDFTAIAEQLTSLAKDYAQTGDNKNAVNCLQKILNLAKEHNPDRLLIASVEHDLVQALFQEGKFQEAETKGKDLIKKLCQEQSLAQAQEILWGVNDVCLRIAMQNRNLLVMEERIQFVHERLSDFIQEPQNSAKRVFFENRQAQFALTKGELQKAEDIFIKTEKEASILSPDQAATVNNNDLGMVYYLQGKFDESEKIWSDRITKVTPLEKGRIHFRLGDIKIKKQEVDQAITHLNASIEIAQKHGDVPAMIRAYNSLGGIYFVTKKNLDKAREYWERVLLLAQKNNDLASCGAIASNLGRVFKRVNKNDDAIHYLVYSIRCFETLKKSSPMILGQLEAAQTELKEIEQ